MSVNNIGEIFAIFGITGSVLMLAVGFLIKSIIGHFLKKDLEVFKSKVNLELDKYKYKIELENEKGKIQYALLQEKRALVIERFYSLLMKFDKSAKDLMALFQPAGTLPEHEKAKITAGDANTFLDYYNEHRIYFDESTCKLIDDINEKFRKAWIDFQFKDKIKREKAEDDLWLKSWKTITEEIPAVRREVENNFREILGIK